jgi:hypothetical protein
MGIYLRQGLGQRLEGKSKMAAASVNARMRERLPTWRWKIHCALTPLTANYADEFGHALC